MQIWPQSGCQTSGNSGKISKQNLEGKFKKGKKDMPEEARTMAGARPRKPGLLLLPLKKSQSGNSWTKVPVDSQVRIWTVSTKGSLLHKWQFVEEKCCFVSSPRICSIDYSNELHQKILNSHQQANLFKLHHNAHLLNALIMNQCLLQNNP